MPGIIPILLHLGALIGAVKDLEKSIQDAIDGKFQSSDVKQVLEDIAGLMASGLVSIPGLSSDQVKQIIADVEKVV